MSRLLIGLGKVAEEVAASATQLNELDAQAGDGDLGVTMTTAARTVLNLLPSLEGQAAGDVLRACGAAVAREAPSTSGTLVATGLLRAARAARSAEGDAATVAAMLGEAQQGIEERGKAELGSKTMLDALAPAVESARLAAEKGLGVEAALVAAAEAADRGALSTPSMRPRHGRAGWLAERSAGHEDAGARLVAIILAAAARSAADTKTVKEAQP
jgi:phosphoenolpyruvate---glycerone phosphotransferase subunit DhaL